MKKFVFAAAALLAASSCAAPFSARVSRFQQLPAPNGQSFVIQASDPRLQGGLEFGQYASIVSAHLTEQGYRPADTPASADLVVKMRYDVDTGRERLVSNPLGGAYNGFGYGSFGGFGRGGYGSFYGTRGYGFGFYDPFFGSGDVTSYTLYTSELDLEIDSTRTGQRVFEGTARAQSRDDNLPYLVPKLVDAMFTDFPGNSGETVKITIQPEKR